MARGVSSGTLRAHRGSRGEERRARASARFHPWKVKGRGQAETGFTVDRDKVVTFLGPSPNHRLPSKAASGTPERWQSGRMRVIGNHVLPQGNRGFESLPLRHLTRDELAG